MALQSQSSSASSSTSTGQPSSTSSPPPNTGNALTPGSSIPFSFLIAFIALFLFFLGCGLGTRRAALVLRRNLGLSDPASSPGSRRQAAKPEIWDAWPEMDEKGAAGEKWDMVQPLAATYIREKAEEEAVPHSPLSRQPTAAFPYAAVRPVHSGLGYFPSRAGGILTIHPPTNFHRSPTTSRLSPAAVPPTPRPMPIVPTPMVQRTPATAGAAANTPRVGFFRRRWDSFRDNVYVIALMNELGIRPLRRPRNEVHPEPLKPVEGLQVTVLLAMPSQERKLRAKLKRESHAASEHETEKRNSASVKGKEVLSMAEDPPEIGEEFGELVLGTMQISWDEKILGDGD
ncbi:hypothetical protein EIP91_000761 [Steccherinum ochraceum]|uniref:Uncharacterized protein n=1 Tax=Steccherinum ochraceum TaxID=92696 RepID=A0A4R0RIJ9_9APHY|nr:hypothetical protein EIP91_000761 [Steccherinum ochraceum]